jgi:hypothetical protein
MALKFQVAVSGHKELRKALRSLEDSGVTKELKEVHKATAAVVAPEASRLTPRRSGVLSAGIAPSATQKGAVVRMGRGRSALYAAVIHFGWPKRGIKPQPSVFKAAGRKRDEYTQIFQERMTALVNRVIGS